MDYDDDGILDFISGSYDPGDIYLFRGSGGGRFEKVQNIRDKSGQPVVHHPAEFAKYTKLKDDAAADENEKIMARVASFGSWVAPVDWESDGDLDLLIGSFGGELFLRVNEGTRRKPVYGSESIQIEADGKPLKVHAHANPVAADWDSDGRWDLVVSSGDGSVGWYQNTGSPTEPTFGPRQPLVAAAAPAKFLEQNLKPGQLPVPGVRAQICVTDYNRDGLLDLVVGDYSDVNWLKELSRKETEDLQALVERKETLVKAIGEIRKAMSGDGADSLTKGEQEKKYQSLANDYDQAEKRCKRYVQESRRASFVWLYLRSPIDAQSQQAVASNGGPRTKTVSRTDSEGAAGGDSGPVAVTASIKPNGSDENTRFRLSVQVEIEPGWHVYSSTPDASPPRPIELDLELPDDVRAVGQWQRPEGSLYVANPKLRIYEGTVNFVRDLEVTSNNSDLMVSVQVSYQVCNEKTCLLPTTITKKAPLPSRD